MGKARVLIFEEKHGNRYFHIARNEDLHAAGLKVLTGRYKEGYWYNDPTSDEPKPPDTLNLSSEEIGKMPASVQEDVRKKNLLYQGKFESWEREMGEFNLIKKTVKEKDGKKAWEIIQSHSDYEYEGFELETYENA